MYSVSNLVHSQPSSGSGSTYEAHKAKHCIRILGDIFENMEHSDCKVVCQEMSLPCHRIF